MTPKGKKIVIGISLLTLAGIGGYIYYKHKKDKKAIEDGSNPIDSTTNDVKESDSIQPKQGSTNVIMPSAPIIQKPKGSQSTPKQSTTHTTQTANLPTLVPAIDLLAQGLTKAVNKEIYAKYDNMPMYNVKNQQAFKTKKGQFLGLGSYAVSTASGAFLWLKNPNGIIYGGSASAMSVKI